MKHNIVKLLEKVGVKSSRTKNIIKHLLISFLYKGGAVLSNFLLVPLTIEYLDTENYGVWLTITSFISWLSFLDIGLGNGLRNKFAEAKANNNLELVKGYISSAYYSIFILSSFLFIVFFAINNFIDWTLFFNSSSKLRSDLSFLMPIVVGFFCIQLIVKLIVSIYLADQNHSVQVKIQFITQAILLFIVWQLTKTDNSSLLVFGTLFSCIPVVVLLIFNVFAFSNKYKAIKPSFKYFNKKYLKDVMGIGVNFFIIQVAAIILFSTDNFIISQLFSPEEVVPYNIAFKYFSILTMLYTMIVAPYWSSFTQAFTLKDFEWIKKSVKNILKIWFIVPILLIIMLLLEDWFYNIWIGEKVIVPLSLSISMALFVLLFTFNMVFTQFINGVGKIKIQLITAITSMIINIPLSILFANFFNMGTTGVIIATCVSMSYAAVLRPMQYYKIINNKAKGIWAS